MRFSKSMVQSIFSGVVGRRVITATALYLAVFAVSGCGGSDGKPSKPRATASGKATFDGKPIPAGFVTFIHKESGTSASCPISEGEYESVSGEGPLIGDNAVTVSALDKVDGQPLFGGGKPMDVKVEASGYTGDVTLTAEDVKPVAAIEVDDELQQATK